MELSQTQADIWNQGQTRADTIYLELTLSKLVQTCTDIYEYLL